MSDLFASIVATYQAVGSLFRPLRSPDDVAAFIDLEAGLPQDMPRHDERLHEGLQQAGAEYVGGAWALGQLRERMQQWPLLQRVIERLSLAPKRFGKVVLISPALECVSCGSGNLRINVRASHPSVYLQDSMHTGEFHYKTCSGCGAKHGLSFARGGNIPVDHVRPLPRCIEAPYFQVYHAVYSTRLLQRFTAQTIHSHTAFLSFCSEYFTLTGESLGRKPFTSIETNTVIPCMQERARAFPTIAP